MVEKDIRRGIFNAIHQYAKANNKYMKDYDFKTSIKSWINFEKSHRVIKFNQKD